MAFIRWLWSDPDTMAAVGGPIPLTDDQAQRWFAALIDPGRATDCYRLILNEANRPIGEVSFHRFDPGQGVAELNIKIASTERGQGYARAALLQFLDFFFNTCGGQVLVDPVGLDNHAGQQALQRFGFEQDVTVQDVVALRLTRQQFNHLYGADTTQM